MSKDPLFCGVFPAGIGYADRTKEEHGDYLSLAFLPFRSLELEWRNKPDDPELVARIERDAKLIQDRRGEHYVVSQCGQTVLLGE